MVLSTTFVALALSLAAGVFAHSNTPHHHSNAFKRDIKSNCNHDFALTYDDGPYPAYTPTIGTTLKDKGAKATFFMNGNNWRCIYDDDVYPVVKQLYDQGHQIAHHGWAHHDLLLRSEAEIDEEIQRLDEAFVKILGIKPRYFRPPYGSITDAIRTRLETVHNKVVVLWDLDSGDTFTSPVKTPQDLLDFYEDLADAAVASGQCPLPPHFVLNHDVQEKTFDSHTDVIDSLQDVGYSLITTAQCMDDESPYEIVGSPGVKDATWTCTGAWTPPSPPPPAPVCLRTYYSVAQDTCEKIGTARGMTAAEVLAANTFLTCDNIWVNTPICVTTASDPAPPTPPTCLWTYTTTAADRNNDCATIATNTGMTKAQILAANSFVSCSDVWTNTPICVTVPRQTNPEPTCVTRYWNPPTETTCTQIEYKLNMPAGSLGTANPWVNCADVWAWTGLCIPQATCSRTVNSPNRKTTCQEFGQPYGLNQEIVKYWNNFVNCDDIWANTPMCVGRA